MRCNTFNDITGLEVGTRGELLKSLTQAFWTPRRRRFQAQVRAGPSRVCWWGAGQVGRTEWAQQHPSGHCKDWDWTPEHSLWDRRRPIWCQGTQVICSSSDQDSNNDDDTTGSGGHRWAVQREALRVNQCPPLEAWAGGYVRVSSRLNSARKPPPGLIIDAPVTIFYLVWLNLFLPKVEVCISGTVATAAVLMQNPGKEDFCNVKTYHPNTK